jgi:hypothetical protein
MNSKRNFLKSLLLTATLPLTVKAKNIADELPEVWTKEETEDYWQTIRNDYKLKPKCYKTTNHCKPTCRLLINLIKIDINSNSYS